MEHHFKRSYYNIVKSFYSSVFQYKVNRIQTTTQVNVEIEYFNIALNEVTLQMHTWFIIKYV